MPLIKNGALIANVERWLLNQPENWQSAEHLATGDGQDAEDILLGVGLCCVNPFVIPSKVR